MQTRLSWMALMMLIAATAGCNSALPPTPNSGGGPGGGTARAPGPAASGQGRFLDYQVATLPNGLRVITVEDFACPVVAVNVWYHVGAVDEDPARQGFAHMFEHMMFRGTDHLGNKDHFELIHRAGGDCNAYTSFDQTVYTNRAPANQLPLLLWLEAERMGMLRIDEEGFATERKVVEEERRMGLNRPYSTVFEKLLPVLFPLHPYRWTPIGQIPHLRAAGVEELRAFWHRYYVPNNATLVIVGAVKHADAQKLAAERLGWIPRRPDPPRVQNAELPPPGRKELVLKEPRGPVPMVGLVYRAVPMAHPDSLPLEFLALVLGDGQSSRLNVDLVRKRKLAIEAEAGDWSLEHGGVFRVHAICPPGADPQPLLTELRRHVQQFSDQPITQEEMTKALNQTLRAEVTSAITVSGRAAMLGRYATLFGDLDRVNRRLAEIRAVTPADIQRVARTYLTPDRETTLIVQPDPTASLDVLADDAPAPTPATQPGLGQPFAKLTRPAGFPTTAPLQPLLDTVPTPRHVDKTLASGLRVVVVPDHRVPFVRLTLGDTFGAWSESPAHVGAAEMAARMITRGTKNYTAEQLASELELHAINLEGSASLDVTDVQADCLSQHLDRTVRLMAEVVLRPTFAGPEFDLLRTQTLSNLMIKSQTPDYLAEREFRRQLFGSHPYARTATGEAEDLQRLTVADMADWWTRFIRPDVCTLYIAGDVEPDAAMQLVEKYFAEWKAAGPKPEVALAPIPAAAATHIILIDKPKVVQSEIRVGHIGITRQHGDYFATRVQTQYFGGAFNSRLNRSLRIAKGLTYGVGGGFSPERFAGTFTVSTFTKTARTAETVAAILEQLKALQEVAPTDEEINIARSYLVGSFAAARETPQSTVNDLWMIDYSGLPADYLNRMLDGVRKSTAADELRVAKELVHPDRLTIVIVGDAAAVKADLEKIAPVTVIRPQSAGATTKKD